MGININTMHISSYINIQHHYRLALDIEYMLESIIEQYLVRQVKHCNGWAFKWASPGNRGVPDRIVFLNKQIWFIELKSTTGKRSTQQKIIGKIILMFTSNYRYINSMDDVDKLIVEIMVRL
jgi:hypothetical protein